MEICCKCDSGIVQTKDGVKCNDCAGFFHVSCVNKDTSKKVTLRNWKCEGCTIDNSSGSSKAGGERDPGLTSVLDAISDFRKESNEKWEVSLQKMSAMQTDINHVNTEVASLKLELAKFKVDNIALSAQVSVLEGESKCLNNEILVLKSEINDLQQHSRKNNLIISGIPLTQNENMCGVLK